MVMMLSLKWTSDRQETTTGKVIDLASHVSEAWLCRNQCCEPSWQPLLALCPLLDVKCV